MMKNGLLRLISVLSFLLIGSTYSYTQIRIEAEDYSNMSGIELESTTDEGGGYNVGWFDGGDWMEYEINIPIEGTYLFTFRVAGEIGGTLNLMQGSELLETIDVVSTGGWQNWIDVTTSSAFDLNNGMLVFHLESSTGGFNINRFEMALISPEDNDVPTQPILISGSADVHTVNLQWNASYDSTSIVTGYIVYNNDAIIAYTPDTVMNFLNLAPNTNLQLSVKAHDIAGNISEASVIEVTTDTLPWDLLWSDEFNYEGPINHDKWYFETGGHGWGNDEAQYYTNGDNAYVSDGVLTIEARKENYQGNDFTSSRINSKAAYDFLYGRIEVKAKLPQTNGTWPAIWTLPTDWIYGEWPDCGEFDIMEHSATNNYGYVFGTVHTGAYNHQDGTQKSGGIQLDDVTNTFHTYVLEWYPDHADWYVDDVHIFRFDNEYISSAEWPYDIKHHLLLNVAIGGGLGSTIDYNGEWPQKMIVDYVRVYDFKLAENDTIAPTKPMNLTANPKWTSVDLTWGPSFDNYAVDQYLIYTNGVLSDSVKGLSYLKKELTPLTAYEISIRAKDYSGNLSDAETVAFSTTDIMTFPIPGKIKASEYTLMEGVDTEACTDFDGGENVGWIDANDWLTYTIDVATEGEYYAGFRVASQDNVGNILFLNENDNELFSLSTPQTGGWQKWQTVVSSPFELSAGAQEIKVLADVGGFNLNWIRIGDADFALNLQESKLESVNIYPNPLSGSELDIVYSGTSDRVRVVITGADGKVLKENLYNAASKITIRDINLETGVYFVSVFSDASRITKSLLVD